MGNIIEKSDLIKTIEQALDSDELSVFAGAGLSIGAGYASWESLLKDAAESLKLEISKESHDLISLAQFYCNKNRRSAINELLSKEFSKNRKPTENHNILSQLPISTYWTTNYDTLIEDALKESGKRVSVRKVDKDLQLSYKYYDSVVYKMHGDIQSPSEAVITRDDYEEYGVDNRRLFRDVLEGALLTKTFLFLGFSFNDPNFNFVLSKMRVLLGEDNRTHYYVLKSLSKPLKEKYKNDEEYNDAVKDYEYNVVKQMLRIEDLERYGIKVCLIERYEEITEILEILLNRYKRKTIFISGSAEEYKSLDIGVAKEFISKLSFELVKNGYKIINGYGLGIGTYVINGVTEYCYEHEDIKVEDRLRLMPFPLSGFDNDKLQIHWRKYREEMISRCGIAIYMFGNKLKNEKIVAANGVKEEFDIANSYGVINIPLAFTGYMASTLYTENMTLVSNILKNEEIKYITGFDNTDTSVSKIIKIINRLNNKEED